MKIGMYGAKKKRRYLSTQHCEGTTSDWTHVQNNTCIRNKLLSYWGIHCFESLLQQQNLCLHECEMVLSCIKAQWEKCLIRFAVSIMGEGHDGSMLIPTSYCISIQPTTQWKTFQGNSDVIHTFAFCLCLCYCWHLGLVFCVASIQWDSLNSHNKNK